MIRYFIAGAIVMAASALTFPAAALAQSGTAGLSISGYTQVSETRVDRDDYYYTYLANLSNTGGALTGAIATITSLASNITVVSGQGRLQFSPIPAGSSASPVQISSSNTFTILVNRTVPFDWSQVSWSFNNPFADPGPNQMVPVQSTVTLNGSGSTNPQGGSLTYSWVIKSAPAGSTAMLTNANMVTATFVPDLIGNYVISLTVNNGSQGDTNDVTISTSDVAPTARPGSNQTVSVGATVHLDGTASTDVNGQQLTYQWSIVSYPMNSSSNSSAAFSPNAQSSTPTFTADVYGTWVVGLVVNDGTLSSTLATVTITTANTPPVAVPTATPQTVNVNGLVQLDGSKSTDVDSNPLTYSWSLNTTQAPNSKATLSANNIVNPTFTADVPGTYIAQLIVNDGTTPSQPVTVTITTNALLAPTATPGATQTTVTVGSTVHLLGSGTDPQSLPLTYTWTLPTFPAGSAAALSFPSNARNPTFVADLPGAYAAQLVVNDGFLSSNPVNVSINTYPLPVAVPTTTTPTTSTFLTVSLSGSSSYDPTSILITGYTWSLSTPPGSNAALTGATTEFPTFVPDVVGTYVAQLIVTDADGTSLPATVSISAGTQTITLTPSPLNLTNAPQPLTVTLSPGAGSSPVSVSLSNYDSTVISVSPNPVTIAANMSAANVMVTPLKTGNTSITASAPAYTPGHVSVGVVTPSITVTFNNNATSIVETHTIGGTITLGAAAPQPNGTTVNLASQSGLVTFNPASVVIPAGMSTGTFTVTAGSQGGLDTIIATAPAYAQGTPPTLFVYVAGGISLSNNLTVQPNQSVPLTVTLSQPAPPDGATVNLQSGNTGILTVLPAMVTIAPGATSPTVAPQVTGVMFGTTSITATSGGYNSGMVNASVTAAVSFSTSTLAVSAGGQESFNVLLSSPPSTTVTVTLTSSTGNATVTPSVSFSPNQQSANATITGVSAGSATITASSNNPLFSAAGASMLVTVGTLVISNGSTSSGVANTSYNNTLTASGGITPYTFAFTGGSLGLTLTPSGSTVAVGGTPTSAGTFSIKVTDASGATATSGTFTINASLALSPTVSPTGEVATAFPSTMLTASGGVPPYTFSVGTGTLLGLNLSTTSTTATISGTATSAGTFTIKVTDSTMATATSGTFTVNPPLSLPYSGTTTGEVLLAFPSTTLVASGGIPSYNYTAVGSLLGLTLNSSSGVLSGTPTATGTFTIKVTDSVSGTAISPTFTINAALALPCPGVSPGEAGRPFSLQLGATGGVGSYTYTLASGSLLGMNLGGTTGLISGTPTASGSFSILVTDSAGATVTSCTFTINPAVSLPCPSPSSGLVNVPFSSTLAATGGVGSYTYTLASGSLLGMTLGSTTGIISGTPSATGTFTIRVTDGDGGTATSCTFTINLTLTLPYSGTTMGEVNKPFSATLTGNGGVGSYTYALASGSLLGMTLGTTTGVVSGTPTASGTFTIKVTDSSNATATSPTFTIDPALTMSCPAITVGEAGIPFSSQLSASGGVGTYSYTLASGSLLGLNLGSNTGLISGTPTAYGSFTIMVTDSIGATVTSCTFTIAPALTLPCPGTTTGVVETAFSSQLMPAGGVLPYSYSVALGNPVALGLTLSSTGAISGTPTAAGTFTIKVTDGAGASLTSCTFTISPQPLTFLTTSLPNPTANVSYSQPISVIGGTTPYTWQTSNLPAWMTFAPTGAGCGTNVPTVCGTPTSTGAFNFSIEAIDSGTPQQAVNENYSFTVNLAGSGTIALAGGPSQSSTFSVGANLQVPMTVTMNPAPAGAVTVTFTSSASGTIEFSTTPSSTPTSSLSVSPDTSTFVIYVQASVATGNFTITASATNYSNGTASLQPTPSAFVLQGPNGIAVGAAFSTFQGAISAMTVGAARLSTSGVFVEYEQVGSGQNCSVPIAAVLGSLSVSSPLSFTGGASTQNFNYTASNVSSGMGSVTLTQPSCTSGTPAAGGSVAINVQANGFVQPSTLTVGNNLQTQMSISLNAVAVSNTTVTVSSTDPSCSTSTPNLVFSNSENGAGSCSITVTILAGSTQPSPLQQPWVQGYASSGTVNYTVSSSTYGTVNGQISLAPSGLEIVGPGNSTTSFSIPPGNEQAGLTVYTAYLSNGAVVAQQEVAGGQSLSINVSSASTSVGNITSSMLTITGGTGSATTSFQPASTSASGSSLITASSSLGFQPSGTAVQSATITATVQTCSLTIVNPNSTVGQYLEVMGDILTNCPGVPLTLTVSPASIGQIQLAVNPTDPGSNSIVVTGGSFWVYGLGTGIAPSPSTASYGAGGAGTSFPTATSTVILAPSGVLILGPSQGPGSVTVTPGGAAQTLSVYSWVLSTDGNYTPTQYGNEPVAGNAPVNPVNVPLANPNTSVGTLAAAYGTIAAGAESGSVTFTPSSTAPSQTISTTIQVTQPAGWIGQVGMYGGYNLTQLLINLLP